MRLLDSCSLLEHYSRPRIYCFKTLFNVIHKVHGYVQIFSGDDILEPVKAQYKSHIPKIMILTAMARPDLDNNFDGRNCMFRIQEAKE